VSLAKKKERDEGMDYKKTAQEILNHVGGSKNIISAAHCATRLRLVIADNKKADKGALENVDGVKGVFEASGQLQIILGTGTVNKVFDQFIEIAGVTASSKAEAKEAAVQKQNWFMRAIKLLGDIFVPIIPAIVASGFLMGIMNSLDFMNTNNFIHIDTTSSLYVFANLFSNTAYTFLQILIAFSAAKAFGANPYLGAVIGMITINPALQNAYTVATEGVKATQSVFFGLYQIDMVGYQGHIIPIIIAVWLMSVIEKKLHKVVPEVLDLFVTPLVSVFVTGYLTLAAIGPVFVWAENAILNCIQWLLILPLGLGSLVMGGLYAPTVVTGIHQMYAAIDLGQLAQYGVTYWLPLASAANVAQGAAALAVHGRTRQQYYSGTADWDTIRRVKEAITIPVIGNGDVDSPLKAEALVKQTGCDAVMVGRAVRGNPWLFRELNHYFRTGELLERPSVEEIREMILRHARKQIELKGEFVGIREMRKHVAWYTAGMRHSAGLRRESNTIESYEALEALLSRLA
jgi:PTS system sucrose-specific IIC component